MNDLEEIKQKIENGDITHADIYALIAEIERLRKRLADEEFNNLFGM